MATVYYGFVEKEFILHFKSFFWTVSKIFSIQVEGAYLDEDQIFDFPFL